MATYASATNPFLEVNSSADRAATKGAPGMAKPALVEKLNNIDLLIADNEEAKGKDHDGSALQQLVECLDKQLEPRAKEEQEKPDQVVSEVSEILNDICINLGSSNCAEIPHGKDRDINVPGFGSAHILNQNPSCCIGSSATDEPALGRPELDSSPDEDEDSDHDAQEVSLSSSNQSGHSKRNQHIELIKKLRLQLRDLEKYAYERGELDQVPTSVLAERQSVILETLRERLSLRISMNEIETLKTDELKKQIDKEIHDLIDPLITKEYLLSQLKTQLTDLERYINHLHGTIGKMQANYSNSTDELGTDDQCSLNEISGDKLERPQPDNARDATSKTSRLIRDLITHLICSDTKIQNRARQEQEGIDRANVHQKTSETSINKSTKDPDAFKVSPIRDAPTRTAKFNDGAAWTLHIDKIVLATDSLINLYTLESDSRKTKATRQTDDGLVESVVRRQLIPAIRDLLAYGLIDPSSIPQSTSYLSMIFDPYYVLSSLTCFPTASKTATGSSSSGSQAPPGLDKTHVWCVIEDYYQTRNEPAFQSSSVKTLSQSFNLAPSISGPIKITSKQALLIAVEDIIETLSKCKPNGPESHFKAFIYTALNRGRLATWLRLIFRNKSTIKKFYHSYGFVCQADKLDRFLTTIEPLSQFEFKLSVDVESVEQYIGAF